MVKPRRDGLELRGLEEHDLLEAQTLELLNAPARDHQDGALDEREDFLHDEWEGRVGGVGNQAEAGVLLDPVEVDDCVVGHSKRHARVPDPLLELVDKIGDDLVAQDSLGACVQEELCQDSGPGAQLQDLTPLDAPFKDLLVEDQSFSCQRPDFWFGGCAFRVIQSRPGGRRS